MVRFIDNWMFASHIWKDAKPSPVAINVRHILLIDEQEDHIFGKHVVITTMENTEIPIEGDIIEVLAEFQKYLVNFY